MITPPLELVLALLLCGGSVAHRWFFGSRRDLRLVCSRCRPRRLLSHRFKSCLFSALFGRPRLLEQRTALLASTPRFNYYPRLLFLFGGPLGLGRLDPAFLGGPVALLDQLFDDTRIRLFCRHDRGGLHDGRLLFCRRQRSLLLLFDLVFRFDVHLFDIGAQGIFRF